MLGREVLPADQPAIEATAIESYVAIDSRIDGSELEGIRARWDFGKLLLREREGKKLPKGRLAAISDATGKSRAEISNRMQFASLYPTKTSLSNALGNWSSWFEIVHHMGTRGLTSSETNEWYTPRQYVEAAVEVLGAIDVDPASCEEANKVVQATTIYDADTDGLTREWPGRVWLNPPYGDLAGKFIERLVQQYTEGPTEAAIVLVNAHATDTTWFQLLWDHTLCFTDHRVDFWSTRPKTSGPTHGTVFVYLGPKTDLFAAHFQKFGAIVCLLKEAA